MSDPRVAQLFSQHFVAAHQQVGDFEVVKVDDRVKKNGGNVASYFCTPSGRVIHSVVGPVKADVLLQEARWAVDTLVPVKGHSLRSQMQHVSSAHLAAIGRSSNWPAPMARSMSQGKTGSRSQRIHQLLAARPLAPLTDVYRAIFEEILGQHVSQAAPNLALADRLLTVAEKKGRPLLLVLHKERNNALAYDQWLRFLANSKPQGLSMRAALRDYVVVLLPLKEMPALSHRLNRLPFAAPNRKSPLLVVARSNGEQVGAVTGYKHPFELMRQLARGWVRAAEDHPPSLRRIQEAERFLCRIDPNLSDDFASLIQRNQQQAAAARQDRLAMAD